MHIDKIKDLTEQERLNLLRLTRSKNVGLRTFYALMEQYNSPTNALNNLHQLKRQGGKYSKIEICSEESVLKELENCEKIGARIITIYDSDYPKRLREISDAPPAITVMGNVELLNKNIIAMVGARNSSTYSCRYTQKLARELGESGLIIASGLARGIDTAAHIGSLQTGTIAVIAGGIDNIYPPENHRLYREIAENGVIVSELPFGVAPISSNFPQRNRIISGLSLGVIVVEAGLKSGTLITTRMAAEQGREVFAVPGHPADPRSAGTLKLIDDGAIPLHNYTDVLRELEFIKEDRIQRYGFADSGAERKKKFAEVVHIDDSYSNISDYDKCGTEVQSAQSNNSKTLREKVLESIGAIPIFVEELVKSLDANVQEINSLLMELELEGLIHIQNGKVEKL